MGRSRHSIYLDEDTDYVLGKLAARSGQPPGTLAGLLLSLVLADADVAATVLRSAVAASHSTEEDTAPHSVVTAPHSVVTTPHGAVAAPHSPELFSSLTHSVPEKKKNKKKTELPSEGPEEFTAGWKGYAAIGGRTGSKWKAVESWNALLAEGRWSPTEIRRRWATFAKLEKPQFLPEVHRLLRPSEGKLTDESLHALEVRRRTERSGEVGKAGELDQDSYEAQRARRVAASAPASGHQRPAGGPLMDEGPRPAGA